MRKFVVSDLHGNGDVYSSVMAFLDQIALEEEVELTINGDLIDYGLDDFEMLMDVMERIKGKGNVSIHYLAGNHEWMMYQALKERKPGKGIDSNCLWLDRGGYNIEGELSFREESLVEEVKFFVGNLDIYQSFLETIQDKPILVVHAQAPLKITTPCSLKLKDYNDDVFKAVWTRPNFEEVAPWKIRYCHNALGRDDFFTIVGHTSVTHSPGFAYCSEENFLNIDGGCKNYAYGHFDIDHVPLVEIQNEKLFLYVFGHDNVIKNGYVFDGKFHNMSFDFLQKQRSFLDPSLKEEGKNLRKKILWLLEL